MSDYNNRGPYRQNPDNFRVNIEDDDFSDPLDTLESINGSQRIEFTPNVLNEEDEHRGVNLYNKDKKDREELKQHKKRDKIKASKNKWIFRLVWFCMVFLMALSFASYLIKGSNDFLAAKRGEGFCNIEVPENVTSEELSELLYNAGAIDEPDFFNIYCTVTTKMEYFTPGTFSLEKNMDYEAIINYLQGGNSTRKIVTITFQEGMTLPEIADKLEENNVCKAADILEAANSSDYDNYDMISEITNADEKYYKLEGYMFPDTYEFYVDDDIDSVIGKFLYNFQTRITSDLIEEINNSQYSLDEIITLASIIQGEAANTEDMYMISSILHNRLEYGYLVDIPTLGCDSTIFYPYRTQKDAPEGYTSNYSTYEYSGLPAGAICNPSIEAIIAAVKPSSEAANYYYFCHDKDGNPYYAENSWQHQENLVLAGLVDDE